MLSLLKKVFIEFSEKNYILFLKFSDFNIIFLRNDRNTAYSIMTEHKVKKLTVVNNDDKLVGMYVWSDVTQDKRKCDYFSLGFYFFIFFYFYYYFY